VTNSRVLGFHPIDSYTSRLEKFEDITFTEYFSTYKTDRMTRGSTTLVAKDNLGYCVYKNKKITGFTDFHPTHSPEGFFFDIMFQNICFGHEKELLPFHNIE
jgi:hypothetical protein